jgi:hypothetical protein
VRIAIIAFAALLASSGHAQADGITVPERWRGLYAEDLGDCEARENFTTMDLIADRVTFYEHGGFIRATFDRGPFEILMVVDMAGEGQTWLSTLHFTASPDFSYIQAAGGSEDEAKLTLYRCPRA